MVNTRRDRMKPVFREDYYSEPPKGRRQAPERDEQPSKLSYRRENNTERPRGKYARDQGKQKPAFEGKQKPVQEKRSANPTIYGEGPAHLNQLYNALGDPIPVSAAQLRRMKVPLPDGLNPKSLLKVAFGSHGTYGSPGKLMRALESLQSSLMPHGRLFAVVGEERKDLGTVALVRCNTSNNLHCHAIAMSHELKLAVGTNVTYEVIYGSKKIVAEVKYAALDVGASGADHLAAFKFVSDAECDFPLLVGTSIGKDQPEEMEKFSRILHSKFGAINVARGLISSTNFLPGDKTAGARKIVKGSSGSPFGSSKGVIAVLTGYQKVTPENWYRDPSEGQHPPAGVQRLGTKSQSPVIFVPYVKKGNKPTGQGWIMTEGEKPYWFDKFDTTENTVLRTTPFKPSVQDRLIKRKSKPLKTAVLDASQYCNQKCYLGEYVECGYNEDDSSYDGDIIFTDNAEEWTSPAYPGDTDLCRVYRDDLNDMSMRDFSPRSFPNLTSIPVETPFNEGFLNPLNELESGYTLTPTDPLSGPWPDYIEGNEEDSIQQNNYETEDPAPPTRTATSKRRTVGNRLKGLRNSLNLKAFFLLSLLRGGAGDFTGSRAADRTYINDPAAPSATYYAPHTSRSRPSSATGVVDLVVHTGRLDDDYPTGLHKGSSTSSDATGSDCDITRSCREYPFLESSLPFITLLFVGLASSGRADFRVFYELYSPLTDAYIFKGVYRCPERIQPSGTVSKCTKVGISSTPALIASVAPGEWWEREVRHFDVVYDDPVFDDHFYMAVFETNSHAHSVEHYRKDLQFVRAEPILHNINTRSYRLVSDNVPNDSGVNLATCVEGSYERHPALDAYESNHLIHPFPKDFNCPYKSGMSSTFGGEYKSGELYGLVYSPLHVTKNDCGTRVCQYVKDGARFLMTRDRYDLPIGGQVYPCHLDSSTFIVEREGITLAGVYTESAEVCDVCRDNGHFPCCDTPHYIDNFITKAAEITPHHYRATCQTGTEMFTSCSHDCCSEPTIIGPHTVVRNILPTQQAPTTGPTPRGSTTEYVHGREKGDKITQPPAKEATEGSNSQSTENAITYEVTCHIASILAEEYDPVTTISCLDPLDCTCNPAPFHEFSKLVTYQIYSGEVYVGYYCGEKLVYSRCQDGPQCLSLQCEFEGNVAAHRPTPGGNMVTCENFPEQELFVPCDTTYTCDCPESFLQSSSSTYTLTLAGVLREFDCLGVPVTQLCGSEDPCPQCSAPSGLQQSDYISVVGGHEVSCGTKNSVYVPCGTPFSCACPYGVVSDVTLEGPQYTATCDGVIQTLSCSVQDKCASCPAPNGVRSAIRTPNGFFYTCPNVKGSAYVACGDQADCECSSGLVEEKLFIENQMYTIQDCESGKQIIRCGDPSCTPCRVPNGAKQIARGYELQCLGMSGSVVMPCGKEYDCSCDAPNRDYGLDGLMKVKHCDGVKILTQCDEEIDCDCEMPQVHEANGDSVVVTRAGMHGIAACSHSDLVVPCGSPPIICPCEEPSGTDSFAPSQSGWTAICDGNTVFAECGADPCTCPKLINHGISYTAELVGVVDNDKKLKRRVDCYGTITVHECGERFDCCKPLLDEPSYDSATRTRLCHGSVVRVPCWEATVECPKDLRFQGNKMKRFAITKRETPADGISWFKPITTKDVRARCPSCKNGAPCQSYAAPLFHEVANYEMRDQTLFVYFYIQLASLEVWDISMNTNVGDCEILDKSDGSYHARCPAHLGMSTGVTIYTKNEYCSIELMFLPVSNLISYVNTVNPETPKVDRATHKCRKVGRADQRARDTAKILSKTIKLYEETQAVVDQDNGVTTNKDNTITWEFSCEGVLCMMVIGIEAKPELSVENLDGGAPITKSLSMGNQVAIYDTFVSLQTGLLKGQADLMVTGTGTITLQATTLPVRLYSRVTANAYIVTNEAHTVHDLDGDSYLDEQNPSYLFVPSARYTYIDDCISPIINSTTDEEAITFSSLGAYRITWAGVSKSGVDWVTAGKTLAITDELNIVVGDNQDYHVLNRGYSGINPHGGPVDRAEALVEEGLEGGLILAGIALLLVTSLWLLATFIFHKPLHAACKILEQKGSVFCCVRVSSIFRVMFLVDLMSHVMCVTDAPVESVCTNFPSCYITHLVEAFHHATKYGDAYSIFRAIMYAASPVIILGAFVIFIYACVLIYRLCKKKATVVTLQLDRTTKSPPVQRRNSLVIHPATLFVITLIYVVSLGMAESITENVSTAYNAPALCGVVEKDGFEDLNFCMKVVSSTRKLNLKLDYVGVRDDVYTAPVIRHCNTMIVIPPDASVDDPDEQLRKYASRTDACVVRRSTDVVGSSRWSHRWGCYSIGSRNSQLDRACCVPVSDYKRDYCLHVKRMSETVEAIVSITIWSASRAKTVDTLTINDVGYTTSIKDIYEVVATTAMFTRELPRKYIARYVDESLHSLIEHDYPDFGTPQVGGTAAIQVPPEPFFSDEQFSYYADCGLSIQQPPSNEEMPATHKLYMENSYLSFFASVTADGTQSLLDIGYRGCEVTTSEGDKGIYGITYTNCPHGLVGVRINFPDAMFTPITPATPVITDCKCEANDGCVVGRHSSGALVVKGYASAPGAFFIKSQGVAFEHPYIAVQKGNFQHTLILTSTNTRPFSQVLIGTCSATCVTECEQETGIDVRRGTTSLSSPDHSNTSPGMPTHHMPWYYGMAGTGAVLFVVVGVILVILFFK